MQKPKVVLVGGFLGSGKTTLMAQAGKRLAERGKKVGLITNDQAADLVDTELLKQSGLDVKEVAGACFCCKFDDLIAKGDEFIAERNPDILLSEPVGSCTDLSATVLQPIKKFFSEKFHAAPYSVLVDPQRLRQALSDKPSVFMKSVMYIFSKQLEEADIILLNKADTLKPEELAELTSELTRKFPGTIVLPVSAIKGDGIDEWLTIVLGDDKTGGSRIAEVDYDTYAEGEAVLGWLNASIEVRGTQAIEWKSFAFDLMRALKADFDTQKAEVAHVKIYINAPGTGLVANLTSTSGMPFVLVQGTAGEPTFTARMILNARVQVTPETLRASVDRVLDEMRARGLTFNVVSIESLSPGRPRPTHRFATVEKCAVVPTGLQNLFRPKAAQKT